jgi:hypothetical protein
MGKYFSTYNMGMPIKHKKIIYGIRNAPPPFS